MMSWPTNDDHCKSESFSVKTRKKKLLTNSAFLSEYPGEWTDSSVAQDDKYMQHKLTKVWVWVVVVLIPVHSHLWTNQIKFRFKCQRKARIPFFQTDNPTLYNLKYMYFEMAVIQKCVNCSPKTPSSTDRRNIVELSVIMVIGNLCNVNFCFNF